jgi:crotonobetainyl-CoA:carnitine CoA-transferase CaiB-like acyl-CoA transferase
MGALDGLRVVEAGLLVQGPQAAATLGDWGASVTKVELPGFGDQSRWLPTSPDDSRSGYFVGVNRGKRSVTVDLRTEGGREVFLRLAEAADVVITNFIPGTMEGWGLGYEVLAARNPGLIYASGSTFGPTGPDSKREGADLAAQAAGGLMSTTGVDGGEPTPVGATIADHIASQNLVSGILAALFARGRTGRGQRVDTSLIGGQIWAQASEYTAYLLTGQVPGRANHGAPLIPGLYGIFPTSDGWVAVVGVVGMARRTAFFELMGRLDMLEKFPMAYYFKAERSAIYDELSPITAKRTTDEWCRLFAEHGIRHAPVRDYAQVAADPGVWECGYLVRDEATGRTAVGTPVSFGDTPATIAMDAPELGQHTEEVLVELGYSWEEIAALSETGAI